MRLYIAGPMRGYDEYNFPAFHKTASRLRRMGHTIISPAEMDEADDPNTTKISEEETVRRTRMYVKRDVSAIVTVDALAMLSGWQNSNGAMSEAFVAKVWCKMPLLYAATLLPISDLTWAVAVGHKVGLYDYVMEREEFNNG